MDRITFRTGDGLTLEGELRLPDGPIRGSAVVCHPHPRYGGSKDHPLLWAVRNELARGGFAVVSFNFRGVMGSEGSHGGGRTEPADARAAVGRAQEEASGPTFVCGWSFGANVALREALEDQRVASLALIAIPLRPADMDLPPLPAPHVLGAYDRPVHLVAGDRDPICPIPALRTLARDFRRATVSVVKGTDHFFGRRESEPAALVGRFAVLTLLE